MARATRNPAVLSYYALRRAVGWLAFTLPLVLAIGNVLLALSGPRHSFPQPVLQRSVSDYYYTPMGNYLVGALFAIAAFLMCSRGYDLSDEITGYVAGTSALGVALFPSVNPYAIILSRLQVEIGFLHTGFAALMFLALAYFCLFLFRRSSPEKHLTRRKRHRNRIYRACGLIMIGCLIVMIGLPIDGFSHALRPFNPLFTCESLALMAFGVAWLTKGEGILKDKPQNHAHAGPTHEPPALVHSA